MSTAWPGLSAGIAVVDVEVMPWSRAPETAHNGAMAARCRERPAHRRTTRFTQRGVSRAEWDRPRCPTDPTKRIIQ
jgi:hypothetical protein